MVSRDPFGPPELQGPAGRDPYAVVDPECIAPDCVDPNVLPADVELTGFFWTDEVFNKLEGTQVGGSVASYDGSGFVRDLDSKNRTEYLQVRNSAQFLRNSAQYSDHPSLPPRCRPCPS
jgi:hypothetical protein